MEWKDLWKQKIAPLCTVDMIIQYNGGIVVVNRRDKPFGWALPGGFVNFGETVEQAAIREAKEETNLDISVVRQFHTYSQPNRDPRGIHTVTVVIIAQGKGKLKGGDDAKQAKVISIDKPLPKMVFKHDKFIQDYMNDKY